MAVSDGLHCQTCADEDPEFRPSNPKGQSWLPIGSAFCPKHGIKGVPFERILFTMTNFCGEGGGHLAHIIVEYPADGEVQVLPPEFCSTHGTKIKPTRISVARWRELCEASAREPKNQR